MLCHDEMIKTLLELAAYGKLTTEIEGFTAVSFYGVDFCSCSPNLVAMVSKYIIGYFRCDHDGRRVGITADNSRHNRCVNHT